MKTNINLEDIQKKLTDAGAIVFWLKCDETAAVPVLADALGAVLDNEITPDGSGAVALERQTGVVPLISGSFPDLGANDFAFLMVQNGASLTSYEFGNISTNHAIQIITGTSTVIKGTGGSASFNAAATPAVGSIQKTLYTSVVGGNTTPHIAAAGAALTAGTPQLNSVHGNLTNFDDVSKFADQFSSGNDLYGVMLMSFPNGLPADIVVMADWMMEQWIANRKEFYPRITEL